jgi:REP element-mobilizing transposase RayT
MLAASNKSKIDAIVRGSAKSFHVKIHSFVNVGNHLHLVVQTARREWLSNLLRTVSALIARHVMKAERGSPLSGGIRFWQARPFSKIITWGKQFHHLVKVYMFKNRLEAVGFTTPAARFYAEVMQT